MEPEFFLKYVSYGKLAKDSRRDIDDFVDRLNYRYTSVIIGIMTGIIGMRQYIGKQIECWIPQEFTKGWEDYAESYCFVSNTYFSSLDRKLPSTNRQSLSISYYQWAPIFLLIQLIICIIPHCVWKFLMNRCGFNFKEILSIASDCNVIIPKELFKHSSIIANYMILCLEKRNGKYVNYNVLDNTTKSLKFCSLKGGFRIGRRLVWIFLSIKLFTFLEIYLQILAMEKFIGTTYNFYGIGMLYDLFSGREWKTSGHFPRVTFCDFEARKVGKNDPYTLQCVLPLNMFLEKIFIFLWLWFAVMGILTLISIFYWALVLKFKRIRVNFIKGSLESQNLFPNSVPSELELTNFIHKYLRVDCIFIFHLMSLHSGDLIVSEIIGKLWINYLQNAGSLHIFNPATNTDKGPSLSNESTMDKRISSPDSINKKRNSLFEKPNISDEFIV